MGDNVPHRGRDGRHPLRDHGFTLIELMVVMVVIGILAAIAVPVFLAQRDRAQVTALKTDVRNLAGAVSEYYLENTGGVAIDTGTVPGSVGLWGAPISTYQKLSPNVRAAFPGYTAVPGQEATTWCVALAAGSIGTYRYMAQGGLQQGDCPWQ